MNADEFTNIAMITLLALWIAFLLIAGFCALACSGYLRPGKGARAQAPTRSDEITEDEPRRCFNAAADLQ